MSYKQVEEYDYNNCKVCGKEFRVTSTHKEYCSISCGYRYKMCNKYHCPTCNKVSYSLDKDPYCSKSCRKEAVDKYNIERVCDVCGSYFYTDKFTYVCSDYCKEEDTYEP